jgi:NAD(P)-dependent dehydrogenase (short-subunit alcohol dehydrogenase family)
MSRTADLPAPWTAADVPDQHGRVAVVTGANTGLGYETAKVLAEHGAAVVLACRDPRKAADAAARIREAAPDADLATVELDLASFASIRRAAGQLGARYPRLDLLINNAGLIALRRELSEDGFELHFAVNHLGHFMLTGLLLDRLLPAPCSRIVTVASVAHRNGRINFDDLQSEHRFRSAAAYPQSKLANLMFTYELQRRLDAAGAHTIAVAAHPGNAHTDLIRHLPQWIQAVVPHPAVRRATRWLFQSAHMGALATLRAATDPRVRGGEYYGPPGRLQFTGHPERVASSARSRDTAQQRRLWDESERLTGLTYPLTSAR